MLTTFTVDKVVKVVNTSTVSMRTSDDEALVSLADIAGLAGYTRPAISNCSSNSNWRSASWPCESADASTLRSAG